jgi:hyperosmotically inducible periplasmic protein
MKRTRSVAATFALASALAAAGGAWAADAMKSADPPIRDSKITKLVRSELHKDTVASGIKVKTRDGVVQLSGIVATQADREKAEQDARGVAGVSDVKNDLTVSAR